MKWGSLARFWPHSSFIPLKVPVSVASSVKKGFKRALKRELEELFLPNHLCFPSISDPFYFWGQGKLQIADFQRTRLLIPSIWQTPFTRPWRERPLTLSKLQLPTTFLFKTNHLLCYYDISWHLCYDLRGSEFWSVFLTFLQPDIVHAVNPSFGDVVTPRSWCARWHSLVPKSTLFRCTIVTMPYSCRPTLSCFL